MVDYKLLAKQRLLEGRLIKTENVYMINKSKCHDKDYITNLILENVTYIGFDTFLVLLMKSFQKFFEKIDGSDYIIIYNEDRNKSDLWVLLLLLRYGKKFLKKLYKDPTDIIELNKSPITIPDKMIYLFCDDFIYSGTQMFYTLEKFAFKSSTSHLKNVYIVCAGITQNGINRLNTDKIFYEYNLKSIGELVNPENYKKIEKEMNNTFPQPFIDKFNYMNNVPIYMEHKLPDTMSSFPEIIIKVINNCKWNNNSRIVDGSDETTMCAHPFYKTINMDKGLLDKENEKLFINKCIRLYVAP
jgi:hypothetical protein